MKIIMISGKAQAGKTTTAYLMEKNLKASGKSAIVINYADLLKYICSAYFDWDGQKDEKGRQLLQVIGTDVVRNNDPDFWVDFVRRFTEAFARMWDYVIIGDCRFKNEVSWAEQAHCECFHVRIKRDADNGLTEEQKNHISEIDLDDVEPDYEIKNNGSVIDLDKAIISTLSLIEE